MAERGIWVVCVDERPNLQVLERRPVRRAVPGSVEQVEFEYVRHGTANVLAFLAVHTTATARRRPRGLIDDIPPTRGRRGRLRRRPEDAYGDRVCRTPANHRRLRRRQTGDHFARPRTPHRSALGRGRQVVERALCWIGQARRLKIRYGKLPTPRRALHYLQMARMCCRILERRF